MKVAITGHRKNTLFSLLKKERISFQDFINTLEKFIIKNFDKEKDIFFVGGSDGFDNIFTGLLVKSGYKYILKLSKKDIEGRQNWNKEDFNLFNKIKEKASQIDYVPGSYVKRDYELIKEADLLIMFISPGKIGQSGTWTTFELFFKQNLDKEIEIVNVYNYNFLKLIKLVKR